MSSGMFDFLEAFISVCFYVGGIVLHIAFCLNHIPTVRVLGKRYVLCTCFANFSTVFTHTQISDHKCTQDKNN